MKLAIYSDLHLEFGDGFFIPEKTRDEADVLVLAGDIIIMKDPEPLISLLNQWENRPVVYVAGNHEYYTNEPWTKSEERLLEEIHTNYPSVHFLRNEPIIINGVQFFGGTGWTNFLDENEFSMQYARDGMIDYRYIKAENGTAITPRDTVMWHANFMRGFDSWLTRVVENPCVVVTHHAPVMALRTQYRASPLSPAFVSFDMQERAQRATVPPSLWIYGHTHENDDQTIEGTRYVSNQRGYRRGNGTFECGEFDEKGLLIEV